MATNLAAASIKSSGSSTSRTFATRLADIFNVKDYGAVGNNVADDTTAIQATIDAAIAAGGVTGTLHGATVFFPPGLYKTTAALTFASSCSIRLLGSGRQCCAIIGSFTGYIIDKPDNNRFGPEAIEHLYIKNTSTNASSGAIRFNAAEGGLINMCYIQGFSGIVANANANNVRISNCFVTNPQGSITTNQVGIAAGQCQIVDTSLQGWDTGILCTNGGTCVHNCRVEVNNYGVYVNGVTGFYLGGGTTFESNGNAVYVNSVTGGVIESLVINGVNGAAPGSTNPQTGILILNATALMVQGVEISASCDIAGMDLYGNGNQSGTVVCLKNISSTSWKMPPGNAKSRYLYEGCDQPGGSTTDAASNVSGMSYANLPGQSTVIITTPIEGMTYDIIDCNTTTFRATAAGGGSNHCRVRYNAGTSTWQVVG